MRSVRVLVVVCGVSALFAVAVGCGPERDLSSVGDDPSIAVGPGAQPGSDPGVGPTTNPGTDPGTNPAPQDADSDGDGLMDGEEQQLGTDPYAVDSDGDGWSDSEELWTENTNPLDGADRPYTGGWSIGSCRWDVQPTGNAVGQVAEDFALVDQFGDTVRLHDFCDRAVLLVSSADWCGACQVEAPELQSWYQQYEAQGFIVITLLGEGDPAAWANYFGLDHPVVRDPGYAITGRFVGPGSFYLPAMHLLGESAVVIEREAWISQSDVLNALP